MTADVVGGLQRTEGSAGFFCARPVRVTAMLHSGSRTSAAAIRTWVSGEAEAGGFADLTYVEPFSGQVAVMLLLEQAPEMGPENSIFWDSRADWYVSPDVIPKFSAYP